MTSNQALRLAVGASLLLLSMCPLTRHALEREMSTHMLVQIPLLFSAGLLIGSALMSRSSTGAWNEAGIPGLLAVSLITAFWMSPIAIDRAVIDAAWDAAKATSLLIAGALAAVSWTAAPAVVQAFFGGNLVWMTIAVGQIYDDSGLRLCNAYLQDDQAITGAAMTWLAGAVAALWLVSVVRHGTGDRH